MQVGSALCKCGAAEFQNGHPASGFYYPHQTVYKHGPKGSQQAPQSSQYADALFTRPEQTPVHPQKPNLGSTSTTFLRFTRFGLYWSGNRRRLCGR